MARRKLSLAALAALMFSGVMAFTPSPMSAQSAGQRVRLTGELVDTFCTVSAIMFASGTAHYQCAVWCAVGGIPVSLKTADGALYMVLRIEEEESNVAHPKLLQIMANEATVDGELIERDGVKYILVTQVADAKGVIRLTHDEHGIQPFGQ